MEYNRSWINSIDSNTLDIYPIQFANCDRLRENDAVYIFDEVGSGKTISSGLMALDYQRNHPGKKVAVITTNALAKPGSDSNYGQFLKDWFDKLPFQTLELTDRITVINNHYSNIEKLKKEGDCGLLIIDEAQLFLNDESLRNDRLRKLRAEKIVFLTATPIKTSKRDLHTYVSIAREILQNPQLDENWIEEIGTEGKDADSLICSKFDETYPVTRYFKDTIMSINVKGYEKKQARRLIPQLWEYKCFQNNKNEVMLRKINECLADSPESRFVVFTRFVEREAVAIGKFLEENGFSAYMDDGNREKTYKIVTGENNYELDKYKGHDNLPTVLILTYQIAEQGVNLPGYNYVINYHVSAFPSALEQRFGRIDRMGKKGSMFPEINMCFLIAEDWDTNTWNFYCAVSVYLRNLITYLPSKNTILSEEIVKKYISQKANVEKYIEKIKDLLEKQINLIIEYFVEKNNTDRDPELDVECKCDRDLYEFFDENAIEMDCDLLTKDPEKAVKDFKREIIGRLKEYEEAFDNGQLSNEKVLEIIRTLGDKVFYQTNGELHTIDAIEECGKIISNNPKFREYKDNFAQSIKLPLIAKKYTGRFNGYFENCFLKNEFNSIFPEEGYRHILEPLLDTDTEISSEDKELLLDNAKDVVQTLPFFKMCLLYREIIQSREGNLRGGRTSFDYNPFQSAFCWLYRMVRQSDIHLGLSDEFFNMYFGEKDEPVEWRDRNYDRHPGRSVYVNSAKYYKLVWTEENILQIPNWCKLAYHYTESVRTWDNRSLFAFYYFTSKGNIRKYSYDIPYINKNTKYVADRWATGIIRELYGLY